MTMNNAGCLRHLLVLVSLSTLIPSLHCIRGPRDRSPPPSSASVEYNHGKILTSPTINVYVVWYGTFTSQEKAPIADFFGSFGVGGGGTTVASWWAMMQQFKDAKDTTVSGNVKLALQIDDTSGSMNKGGSPITRDQLQGFMKEKIESKALPLDTGAVYFLITDKNVSVESFCVDSCGFHDQVTVTQPEQAKVAYVHIGDPSTQCPGLCGWPYALPQYGPKGAKPLVAPNGLAVDSMVMQAATLLADAATNPFKDGYYQGDAEAPLGPATACTGIFGKGAYPGYPGELMVDPKTDASYNVKGVDGREYLLTAIWDMQTQTCKAVS